MSALTSLIALSATSICVNSIVFSSFQWMHHVAGCIHRRYSPHSSCQPSPSHRWTVLYGISRMSDIVFLFSSRCSYAYSRMRRHVSPILTSVEARTRSRRSRETSKRFVLRLSSSSNSPIHPGLSHLSTVLTETLSCLAICFRVIVGFAYASLRISLHMQFDCLTRLHPFV